MRDGLVFNNTKSSCLTIKFQHSEKATTYTIQNIATSHLSSLSVQ